MLLHPDESFFTISLARGETVSPEIHELCLAQRVFSRMSEQAIEAIPTVRLQTHRFIDPEGTKKAAAGWLKAGTQGVALSCAAYNSASACPPR